jgi:hypothetical protein
MSVNSLASGSTMLMAPGDIAQYLLLIEERRYRHSPGEHDEQHGLQTIPIEPRRFPLQLHQCLSIVSLDGSFKGNFVYLKSWVVAGECFS